MDLSVLSLRGLARANTAVGPSPADDSAAFMTGPVYEVDAAGARVRVGVAGSAVWLPAVADRYTGESLARVLLDPFTSRPVLVVGAVRPREPAVLGRVLATPTGGKLAVQVDEVDYLLPVPMGAYAVDGFAWVMLDGWGIPFLVVGPSSVEGRSPEAPGAPSTGGTQSAQASIGPQWSGTWRQSRWGNWNQDRYGGPTDIYQGDRSGSGPLIGFAGYGDQIVNLGAVSIERIRLTARKNDVNGLSASLAVQTSGDGGQPGGAPGGWGDVVSTGSIGPGGWGDVELTAGMREAFRTGAAKGLIAVGGDYGGFGGTATPGSFVLTVDYTRNA